MNLGKINLITPPDKLFNNNLSYLLVKPSTKIKMQFQTILSSIVNDLNVFIYDQEESNIEWLLSVAGQVDEVVIDIDNCDPTTKHFISLLLAEPNVYYITNDELTPWGLISKNRIYDLDWIVTRLQEEDEDSEEEDTDEQ
jgi:hypothetical protein